MDKTRNVTVRCCSRALRRSFFNRELSHSGERRFEMLDVTMQQVADWLGLGAWRCHCPPLTRALEKQLGLKLVKQNASVDVLVIDRIGRLSKN